MAQCFISTYRNHYRWPDPEVTVSAKPTDGFMKAFPPEDIWIGTAISDDKLNVTDLEKLRLSYLKRMISTYKISYCKKMLAQLLGDPAYRDDASVESELLRSCKNLYEPEGHPRIAAPLPNTRKAFGYIRPSDNYTPLSTYQDVHGRTAYKLLEREPPAQHSKKHNCCCRK